MRPLAKGELGRLPEPGIVDKWVGAFEKGFPNENVVADFVDSPEYCYWLEKGHGNRAAWISSLYRDVFERAATAEEINGWLNVLV